MNENVKTGVMLLIGFCIGFLVCYTLPCNSDDTKGTISAIKEQQSGVNTEIGNAGNGIDNATSAVKRAGNKLNEVQERLIESERIAGDNASRIDSCKEIAKECRSLAEQNRAILDNVGKAN